MLNTPPAKRVLAALEAGHNTASKIVEATEMSENLIYKVLRALRARDELRQEAAGIGVAPDGTRGPEGRSGLAREVPSPGAAVEGQHRQRHGAVVAQFEEQPPHGRMRGNQLFTESFATRPS